MGRTDTASLCYHGSVRKNKGMWGNTEIGVVSYGGIRTCYLCFTYTPVFTVSLVFRVEWARERAKCKPWILKFHIFPTKCLSST